MKKLLYGAVFLATTGMILFFVIEKNSNAINDEHTSVNLSKRNMLLLAEELSRYKTICGTYPSSLDILVQANNSCPNFSRSKYKKEVFLDGWGKPFIYSGHIESFKLLSNEPIPFEINEQEGPRPLKRF